MVHGILNLINMGNSYSFTLHCFGNFSKAGVVKVRTDISIIKPNNLIFLFSTPLSIVEDNCCDWNIFSVACH
jgi:hypothetical protein